MDDDVTAETVGRIRAICTSLPEAQEERAWTGTRWRIRSRTFAHVLAISDGWPPAYARAAATDGPVDVLMFRSSGPELDALRRAGGPFFAPPWRNDEVGLALGPRTDWSEIEELLTESYCLLAPGHLASRISGAAARLTQPQRQLDSLKS